MGAFKTGLFGCIGNPSLSLIACCIAPVTIARQAAYIGDKAPIAWVLALITGGPCIAGASLRGQIRAKKGIDGTFVNDCLLWTCCGPCAICQEAAETGVMDDLVSPELQQMERGS